MRAAVIALLVLATSAIDQPIAKMPAPFFARDGRFQSVHSSFSSEVTSTGLSHRLQRDGQAVRLDWQIDGVRFDDIHGELPLEARVHVLVGDRSQWRRNLPAYDRVRATSRSISLVVDVQPRLRWTLELAPGVAPSSLSFRYLGARALSVTSDGALHVHTSLGELVESQVRVFQQRPDGSRTEHAARFVVDAERYFIEAAGLDPSLPTLIDPPIDWARFVGGTQTDSVNDAYFGPQGNFHVAGTTASADLPTAAAYDASHNGLDDAFVARFTGTALTWLTFLGAAQADGASAVAVSPVGDVVVAGRTDSTNFPTVVGAYQATRAAGIDAFVSVLSADGSMLRSSTLLGGAGSDEAFDADVDSTGNIFVTGQTRSADFPVLNAIDTSMSGADDVFVAGFSPAGAALRWMTFLGGTTGEVSYGIAADPAGDVYVTGQTSSPDFPITSSSFGLPYVFYEAFVVKYSGDGTTYRWSGLLVGDNYDYGLALFADSLGVTVTGGTYSSDFPKTTNALQSTFGGGTVDAFVSRISANGATLLYSTFLGGNLTDVGYGIVQAQNRVHLGGASNSTSLPGFSNGPLGGNDGFAAAFDIGVTGSTLVYGVFLGGPGADSVTAMSQSGLATAVVGSTQSTSLSGADSGMLSGTNDGFIWLRTEETPDAGVDAGTDAGIDGGADAGEADAGVSDGGSFDGGGPDAGADGGGSDAGLEDAGEDAARQVHLNYSVGCGCGATDFGPLLLVVFATVLRVRRRRLD